MSEQEERRQAISHIVNLYEEKLQDVIKVEDTFNLSRLPESVQAITNLTIAKTPSFSTIVGLSTANYVMSHVIGQCRPRINANEYSSDLLGLNTYTVVVAKSGAGKSSSTNTLLKACEPALNLVIEKRRENLVRIAKNLALRDKRVDQPNFQLEDLTPLDYEDLIPPMNRTVVSASSTRGGLSRLLDKLQREEAGNLAIMFDELGLSLKQGQTAHEVIQLLIESFDIGDTLSPEFKTDEVKESPITGMYSNFLGHTSPKVLFGDPVVRELILMLFHTALARRCWFTMPGEEEDIENNKIPSTLAEAKQATSERLEKIANLSIEVSDIAYTSVQRLIDTPTNRTVHFTEETAELYLDYYDFCQKRSELMEDSSISQVEMAGRPFKLVKLAGIWELWNASSDITYNTLAAAIYFAEYNSKYLDKFVTLTTSKAYKLLGEVFKSGKTTEMSLDSAITNGYVSRVSADFRELLEPMNSYLRTSGVATYDSTSKYFIYTPFKKVETIGDYGISYSKCEGKSKTDRGAYFNNFENYKLCDMRLLKQIVSKDTVYNVFKYKDEDDVKMKRSQVNIDSTTKLLSIDVDEALMPLEKMHEYLHEFKHIIATTSDSTNHNKYRILLPVNVEIDGTKSGLYKCIIRKVSETLLIPYDPSCGNPNQVMFGYTGAEVLSNEEGELFDVTGIITDCANEHVEGIQTVVKPKTPAAKKKLVEEMLANANKVFEYVINCPRGTGSLSLARASLHMKDSGFNREQYIQVMKYLNSCWQNSMPDDRFDKIVDQFSGDME